MRVIIETPYAGDRDKNVEYARKCMYDSLIRGESPFLSHLLYTQVLDDDNPAQRLQGMKAGWDWMAAAEKVVVYTDLGISKGMQEGISYALDLDLEVEYRTL